MTSRGPQVRSGREGSARRASVRARRGHEQQRHDHRDDHVHDHVHREEHPAPDVGGAARGPHEGEPAQGPQDRAVHRPHVAATPETDDTPGIQGDGKDRDGEHEPVGPPRRQPVGVGHRPRVRKAGVGQDRTRVLLGVGHRWRRPPEDRTQPEGGRHESELEEHEARERGATVADGGDDPSPLLPADDAERDDDRRLGQDHRPVGRADPREGTEPDDGLLQAGEGDRGIGPAGEDRVAGDGGAEVVADARPHDRDGEQAPDPDGDADEVHSERVDRILVAGAARGVPGERDDDDAGQAPGRTARRRTTSSGRAARRW